MAISFSEWIFDPSKAVKDPIAATELFCEHGKIGDLSQIFDAFRLLRAAGYAGDLLAMVRACIERASQVIDRIENKTGRWIATSVDRDIDGKNVLAVRLYEPDSSFMTVIAGEPISPWQEVRRCQLSEESATRGDLPVPECDEPITGTWRDKPPML